MAELECIYSYRAAFLYCLTMSYYDMICGCVVWQCCDRIWQMAELECMYSNRGQARDMISSHTHQHTKPDKSLIGGRQNSAKLYNQNYKTKSTKPAHKATQGTEENFVLLFCRKQIHFEIWTNTFCNAN